MHRGMSINAAAAVVFTCPSAGRGQEFKKPRMRKHIVDKRYMFQTRQWRAAALFPGCRNKMQPCRRGLVETRLVKDDGGAVRVYGTGPAANKTCKRSAVGGALSHGSAAHDMAPHRLRGCCRSLPISSW